MAGGTATRDAADSRQEARQQDRPTDQGVEEEDCAVHEPAFYAGTSAASGVHYPMLDRGLIQGLVRGLSGDPALARDAGPGARGRRPHEVLFGHSGRPRPLLQPAAGRGPGPSRAERLREVDDGVHPGRPPRAVRGHDSPERAATCATTSSATRRGSATCRRRPSSTPI